jgi:hypothetical protein
VRKVVTRACLGKTAVHSSNSLLWSDDREKHGISPEPAPSARCPEMALPSVEKTEVISMG